MANEQEIRKHHIQSFAKLTLSERLSWAFEQNLFLGRFLDGDAKRINKKIRRNGKKYFGKPNLA